VLTSLRSRRANSLQTGEVAYGTTRAVELFAFSAERLAAGPLQDVLGLDAVAGLAVGIVVVDVRVCRVSRALSLEDTGSFL
jgi:hypothetical protein